jgi:hypothetical protein
MAIDIAMYSMRNSLILIHRVRLSVASVILAYALAGEGQSDFEGGAHNKYQ